MAETYATKAIVDDLLTVLEVHDCKLGFGVANLCTAINVLLLNNVNDPKDVLEEIIDAMKGMMDDFLSVPSNEQIH